MDLEQPVPASARAVGLISTDRFDAVILDMDGVVTDTARVHAAAWKLLFDNYLATDPRPPW